ncbi:cytochrome P450 [Brevibacillus centrosporus]|jgi:cytochrome P450|uniref:cytochrome P450 n=1 Tax=Brevibacillus TaxID=55080 RepID=UPI0039871346
MSSYPVPPGPKATPLVGNLAEFGRDPLGFVSMCAKEYGDVVKLRIEKDRDTYLINTPSHIEYVLANTNRIFSKGYHRDPVMRLVLGNGLITSEGEFWMRQRRLSQPAFHHKRIAGYADIMVEFTRRMISSWKNNEVRNSHEDMMRLTMEIVSKTLFHVDLREGSESISHSIETLMQEYNVQMTSVFKRILSLLGLGKLPTPGDTRLHSAVKKLDSIIYNIIRERRTIPGDRGDLLSMLIEAHDEDDGTRMTDKQLRDEVMSLFLAGHETTANTLSWTWHFLAQHPYVEQKVISEIKQVLEGRLPTFDDLPRLKYVEQVIKEVMRLRPPVWWISREANQDCEIGGFHIPAGSEIGMSQWVMHHDPQYFEDPLTFKPERWDDNEEKHLPKYAYFPFGGGPRVCIGNQFAMMEAVLLVTTIAQSFQLEQVKDHPVILEPSITLRPKDGIQMMLRMR